MPEMQRKNDLFTDNIRKIYEALHNVLDETVKRGKGAIDVLPDYRVVIRFTKDKIDLAQRLAHELSDEEKHSIIVQTRKHIMRFADAMSHFNFLLHHDDKDAAVTKIKKLKEEIKEKAETPDP